MRDPTAVRPQPCASVAVTVPLSTTTLVITHNAIIQDVAHRVLSFANGRISGERVNESRRAAAELAW